MHMLAPQLFGAAAPGGKVTEDACFPGTHPKEMLPVRKGLHTDKCNGLLLSGTGNATGCGPETSACSTSFLTRQNKAANFCRKAQIRKCPE